MVSRSIESAQRKVEARNFDIRKQLLEYDDVANDQRKVLYAQRNEVLESGNIAEMIASLRTATFTELVHSHVPPGSVEEQWNIPALETTLASDWHVMVPLGAMLESDSDLTDEDVLERVLQAADQAYQVKVERVGLEMWSNFERSIMLQSIDSQWREHLASLDLLRQGIHLRGYAQKNPKQEYKREAFELFSAMLDRVRTEVMRVLLTVRIQSPEEAQEAGSDAAQSHVQNVRYHHSDYDEALADDQAGAASGVPQDEVPKVGRNDPCPCGSGKKYKHCHGVLA